MELFNYIDLFLGAFLNVLFCIYIIQKVFIVKTIKDKGKKLFYIMLISFLLTIINIFNKNTFKGIIAIPLISILSYELFNINAIKSIYYSLVASFYPLIGEVVVAFTLSMIKTNFNFINDNILGKTMGNLLVIFFATPFIYIKFISKIFRKISDSKISDKTLTLIFIIFLMIGSAFVFNGIVNIESIISNIMNFIIFIVFSLLLFNSYRTTQKVDKISNEYNSLLNYLDKYEKELVDKRKLIHDFKNQLIVIRGYVDKDIKLKEYLNDIIEEHKNIKEAKIIKNIDKLPKGLKGLVYYKLSQVDDNLKISLNVKSKFKGFEKLNSKDNRNILKIIGILIDNAIESSTNSKDKYILIEILMNNGIFEIKIINSCNNNLEKSKIMDIGFSTKGKDRGYGLSLVKDIMKNDDRYKFEIDVNDTEFKVLFNFYLK